MRFVFSAAVTRTSSKPPLQAAYRIEQSAPVSACGLALAAFALAAAILAAPVRAASHPEAQLTAEMACREIRVSLAALAEAERNQALALHLMADGKPTPIVEARLTVLQARISELRAALRKARIQGPSHDPEVSNCVKLGFRSLIDAEVLSNDVEQVVTVSGGPLSAPLRAGESKWAEFPGAALPPPPAPAAPSRAAPR